MKDKKNLSTIGVNGAATTPRSAHAPNMPPDQVSQTNLPALEQELKHLPASRPEMVARAKALIADPNYPSAGLLSALSRRLASVLPRKSQ